MALRWFAIVGLVVVLQAPAVSAQLRLEGLERVYFKRIAGPGETLPPALRIAVFLPETLRHPGFTSRPPAREESSEALTVHDFELTSRSSNRRLWVCIVNARKGNQFPVVERVIRERDQWLTSTPVMPTQSLSRHPHRTANVENALVIAKRSRFLVTLVLI